jgi:hypothetical protein
MDIVERLNNSTAHEPSDELACRCYDAANEIERLRAALATIKNEAYRVQDGDGNLLHLIRCIHVNVNSAITDTRRELCKQAAVDLGPRWGKKS